MKVIFFICFSVSIGGHGLGKFFETMIFIYIYVFYWCKALHLIIQCVRWLHL